MHTMSILPTGSLVSGDFRQPVSRGSWVASGLRETSHVF